MSRERIVVVGAGGHGAELQAYIRDLESDGWKGELLGYLDDRLEKGAHGNLNIIGKLGEFSGCGPEFFHHMFYLTALGDNRTRREVVRTMERLYGGLLTPWTLIHPTAYVGEGVEIGAGTCLAPGAIVTCRARIGKHSILNIKASISHDCSIGDFVNVNPSATICGDAVIGDGVYIGAGATIINRIVIGAGSIIGAGAVVVDDIPVNVTAVGVPARVIRQNATSF